VSEEAARRPATSAFLTEAERSEASWLGDWGDFSSLVRGVSEALPPESHFTPKPADQVDHCLGIVDLPMLLYSSSGS
jgi:hypothetical protein